MKLKHVVLFGVVASIMSYLNSTLENEDTNDKQESTLNELVDLLNKKIGDIDFDVKMDEFKRNLPEHFDRVSEVAKDVTDNLIEELNSIVASLSEITKTNAPSPLKDEEVCDCGGECSCHNEDDECKCSEEESCDCYEKETNENDTLILELENLLANFESDDETNNEVTVDNTNDKTKEETVEELAQEEFSEDDYLAQIRNAIEATITLDENGEVTDMSDVFEEDDKETHEITQDEIDEIFSEILNGENQEENQEAIKEDKEESVADDAYLSDLVDELNETMEASVEPSNEDTKVSEENQEVDVYSQINVLYPHLSRSFVRAVYDLKESIASEYPLNQQILILHRLSFEKLDELRQFADIVLKHDYRVNVDESKKIVDIFKELVNTDGKILTNIFEIANQAKLLDGTYEGYRIELVQQ